MNGYKVRSEYRRQQRRMRQVAESGTPVFGVSGRGLYRHEVTPGWADDDADDPKLAHLSVGYGSTAAGSVELDTHYASTDQPRTKRALEGKRIENGRPRDIKIDVNGEKVLFVGLADGTHWVGAGEKDGLTLILDTRRVDPTAIKIVEIDLRDPA